MRWMVMVLACAFLACEECSPEQTRCVGNAAEICNSNGQWEPLADCNEISGGGIWSCCADSSGSFNCRPDEECVGGDL